MNRTRIYALTTLATVFLASLSLWLVPQTLQRQLEAAEKGKALPPGMTFKQAQAQVDSALQTYVDGILKGDVELALTGFATDDPNWLAEQRQAAQQVHTRLAGHPARVRHTSGYSVLHWGRPDSVSSAWYSGVLVIQDSLSGELVHETPYFARAQTHRFLLSKPPEDLTLQMRYRLNLGSLYCDLGMEAQALALWKRTLDEFSSGPTSLHTQLCEQIAHLYESQENYAEAIQAYGQALQYLRDRDPRQGVSMGGMQIQGKNITARTDELLKYQLAQCNLKLHQVENARALCLELAKSQTKELAAAARQLIEEQ